MKLSVAIAFGGVSVEHEISILSAMQAIAAFPDAYEIVPLYIAKDGRMYSDASFQKTEVFQDLTKVTQENYEVQLVREHQRVLMQWKKHHFWKTSRVIDFVLPILHGTNGEDGSFQGFLKTLHVPFAQCGVLSGALGQDKVAMKMILQDQGLPLVPWFYWWKQEPLAEAFFAKAQRLGYPMIIKPSNLGSSIGIAVVQ
ncbi:MAG: D-alanine--D-alanine ligase, partial [Longicatena caecimuris]